MSEETAFKNAYTAELARALGNLVHDVYPEFDTVAFVARIAAEVDHLELKDRIRLFTVGLREGLPGAFPEAWAVIEQVLDGFPEPARHGEGSALPGWALWPLARFIEDYGLDHFDKAMGAMHKITQLHTAEFAIRPFIERYPDRSMDVLGAWVHDPSEHVRRLVSEGSRPRLPWAGRLNQFIEDPGPTLALLEELRDDPSEYVRRSVANHLNDISKDHPAVVLETLGRWREDAGPGRTWIIRHALRSLVKAGNPEALRILGYGPPEVELADLRLGPHVVPYPGTLEFSFSLTSVGTGPQELAIDYIIHFVKANGRTSPKVFKLSTRSLTPGETTRITRRHTIRPITTRVYYPGKHRLEIQVNGKVLGSQGFRLEM